MANEALPAWLQQAMTGLKGMASRPQGPAPYMPMGFNRGMAAGPARQAAYQAALAADPEARARQLQQTGAGQPAAAPAPAPARTMQQMQESLARYSQPASPAPAPASIPPDMAARVASLQQMGAGKPAPAPAPNPMTQLMNRPQVAARAPAAPINAVQSAGSGAMGDPRAVALARDMAAQQREPQYANVGRGGDLPMGSTPSRTMGPENQAAAEQPKPPAALPAPATPPINAGQNQGDMAGLIGSPGPEAMNNIKQLLMGSGGGPMPAAGPTAGPAATGIPTDFAAAQQKFQQGGGVSIFGPGSGGQAPPGTSSAYTGIPMPGMPAGGAAPMPGAPAGGTAALAAPGTPPVASPGQTSNPTVQTPAVASPSISANGLGGKTVDLGVR